MSTLPLLDEDTVRRLLRMDTLVPAIRDALAALANDAAQVPDLHAAVPPPRGSGQTYLREVLLVADHTAYHVGQLVMLRRQLGAWPNA